MHAMHRQLQRKWGNTSMSKPFFIVARFPEPFRTPAKTILLESVNTSTGPLRSIMSFGLYIGDFITIGDKAWVVSRSRFSMQFP